MGVLEVAANKPVRVQLDTTGVGERLGIDAASVRRYSVADRSKYGFPEPDGHIGRSPWWWSDRIDEWAASRPGRGAGAGRPRKAAPAKRARKPKP
jgi:hypothetical protein